MISIPRVQPKPISMDPLGEIRRERAILWKNKKRGMPAEEVPAARARSRSPRKPTSVEIDAEPVSSSSDMRILSWNIDGLDDVSDEEDMLGRTLWVVEEILRTQPNVIFLQELVDFNFAILTQRFQGSFHIFKQQMHLQPYFVAIMVHKGTMEVSASDSVHFPTSRMGRGGVYVSARRKGTNCLVGFITGHLESLRESSTERQTQLRTCLEFAKNVTKEEHLSCFVIGGDLNIRDTEVPPEIKDKDAWILAGRKRECEYTWDLSRNDNAKMPNGSTPKCRFDRFYVLETFSGSATKVTDFSLIGTARIQGLGRFASDHFGILINITTEKQV
jgi:endonuclease/exonuclease/phosphatase family metal-dependent hydrolase